MKIDTMLPVHVPRVVEIHLQSFPWSAMPWLRGVKA